MGFLKSSPRRSKYGGYIKYFGLEKWYSGLTERQRTFLRKVQPTIETGNLVQTSQTAGEFLGNCASALAEYGTDFAGGLFDEALNLERDPVKRHFILMTAADFYRRHQRDVERWYKTIVEDIELLPEFDRAWKKEFGELPAYSAINEMLQILWGWGDLPEAIELCRHAQKLGVAGDWEQQIQDMKRRIQDP
jgi:hypothetical protein